MLVFRLPCITYIFNNMLLLDVVNVDVVVVVVVVDDDVDVVVEDLVFSV